MENQNNIWIKLLSFLARGQLPQKHLYKAKVCTIICTIIINYIQAKDQNLHNRAAKQTKRAILIIPQLG